MDGVLTFTCGLLFLLLSGLNFAVSYALRENTSEVENKTKEMDDIDKVTSV